jgi:hypothetical protein
MITFNNSTFLIESGQIWEMIFVPKENGGRRYEVLSHLLIRDDLASCNTSGSNKRNKFWTRFVFQIVISWRGRIVASYPRFENSGGMSLKQFVIPGLTKLSTLYLTNAMLLH